MLLHRLGTDLHNARPLALHNSRLQIGGLEPTTAPVSGPLGRNPGAGTHWMQTVCVGWEAYRFRMETDPRLDQISKELSRIQESALYSSQSQFENAKLWRLVNLLLGIPATALGGLAGVSLLADTIGKDRAGIIVLAAAGFGAVMTLVNASDRTRAAQAVGADYQSLEQDARVARLIDLPGQEFDDARTQLSELVARRKEINSAAPSPPFIAYWRGKRNIEKGRQTPEIDKGKS